MIPQPRWYQRDAVQSIFDYFGSGKTGNPVVAMPTASGKSLVIGGFIYRVLQTWSDQRFMVATHVKELIAQNFRKFNEIMPGAPAGIFSAGLKQKDVTQPVIFGGVASMYRCAEVFGHRDLLLIDECHLLNPKGNGMYAELIKGLKNVNPKLKVIGFSASPYRQGHGLIIDDGLFTDFCYDLTTMEGFARLIDEGFLSTLIPRPTEVTFDISGVGVSSSTGDYIEGALQAAVNQDPITYAALQEIMRYGYNCRAWMIFAAGVEHAVRIAEMLNGFGVPAGAVHDKLTTKERDDTIKGYLSGKLRCIVNNNILTTGFDHPPIDLIGMMRPTLSTSLWVQMLGRGMRVCEGKNACLVLDFARNTLNLGPINDPVLPRRKGKATRDAPVKICPNCHTYNHTSARFCVGCGHVFEFETKIVREASTEELIRPAEQPQLETYAVNVVQYFRHQSKDKPLPSLKVCYFLSGNLKRYDEYVNLEHDGFAGKKAREWWRTRTATEPPTTIAAALQQTTLLRQPARIRVWVNKRPYPEIVGYEYDN